MIECYQRIKIDIKWKHQQVETYYYLALSLKTKNKPLNDSL